MKQPIDDNSTQDQPADEDFIHKKEPVNKQTEEETDWGNSRSEANDTTCKEINHLNSFLIGSY